MTDFDEFTKHLRTVKGYIYCPSSDRLYQKSFTNDGYTLVANTKEDLCWEMKWRYDGDWNSYRNDPFTSIRLTEDGIKKALDGLMLVHHTKPMQKHFSEWLRNGN